jgi:hypothetical protein
MIAKIRTVPGRHPEEEALYVAPVCRQLQTKVAISSSTSTSLTSARKTHHPVKIGSRAIRVNVVLRAQTLAHDCVVELVRLLDVACRIGVGRRASIAWRVLLADDLGLQPAAVQLSAFLGLDLSLVNLEASSCLVRARAGLRATVVQLAVVLMP